MPPNSFLSGRGGPTLPTSAGRPFSVAEGRPRNLGSLFSVQRVNRRSRCQQPPHAPPHPRPARNIPASSFGFAGSADAQLLALIVHLCRLYPSPFFRVGKDKTHRVTRGMQMLKGSQLCPTFKRFCKLIRTIHRDVYFKNKTVLP